MTTTTGAATEVLGTGVYVEARRDNSGTIYTTQIILLPEAVSGMTRVPMTMIHRRLSAQFPKKTWKQYSSGTTTARELPNVESAFEVAERVAAFALKHMETLAKAGYKTVGPLAYFQYTREDADAVRVGRTPYKIVGRINKLRKELKYPEDIIAR